MSQFWTTLTGFNLKVVASYLVLITLQSISTYYKEDIELSCYKHSTPNKLFQKIAFKTNCASIITFTNNKTFDEGTLDTHGVKDGDTLWVDYYKPENWKGDMYENI